MGDQGTHKLWVRIYKKPYLGEKEKAQQNYLRK